jgi:saccharopine dehydrogenase (NAD+, L-lysine-forming)
MIEGLKGNEPVKYYIYNICDHAACFEEIGAQAVSYTTGVPAMIGAMLMLTNVWKGRGVFNVEEFDPEPFMENLGRYGLPWQETFFEPNFESNQ